MADFVVTVTGGDASDPAAFEANVRAARARGHSTIALAAIQRPTVERATDPEDTWQYFTFINAALFNIFETDLIHGYLQPDTYRINQEALRWKSAILQRHGMRGSLTVREPQWMPTPWYADKPELKGCRCEHPAVARSPHWALNIDHPRVLAHYAQLARRLAEVAPAVAHLVVQTNDSGAGINWCDGLYPGPNGPADTRDRDMGERVEAWFEAMRGGAREAGVDLQIDFVPTHFTPKELKSAARALTRSGLMLKDTDPRTTPFPNPRLALLQDLCRGTATDIIYTPDVANGYVWSGLIAPPQVYLAAERLMELRDAGVRRLGTDYTCETPLSDQGSPVQQVFERCVARCPRSLAERDRLVAAVAADLVGEAYADGLVSAWRDVDIAIRIHRMDYQHNYYFFYGTIGRRWLTRPLVPRPERLTEAERAYWSRHLMRERDPELTFQTLMAEEGRRMFSLDEYPSHYNGLEWMARHFARAVRALEAECARVDAATPAGRWLRDQRDRIECFGRLFLNQLHVTGVQWVLDGLAAPGGIRPAARTREKKRLGDMIDGEIANVERLAALLDASPVPLIATGEEATYTLPRDLPAQLRRKAAIMRRHRQDVEACFPGVDDWNFDRLTYSPTGEVILASEAGDLES